MIRFYFRFSPEAIQKIKGMIFLIIFVTIGISLFKYFDLPRKMAIKQNSLEQEVNISPKTAKRYLELMGVGLESYKNALSANLPALAALEKEETKENPFSFLYTFLNIDPANPLSFFGKGLSSLATVEVMAASSMESYPLFEDEGIVEILDVPIEDLNKEVTVEPAKDPQVAKGAEIIIINTHNAETYKATDGVSKKEGKNSGVAKVAARLEKILIEQYQYQVARSDRIHDYPKFEESYTNSGKTLKELIEQNPQARVVIDIHRDAGHPKPLVTTINGKKAAQIRLIVGSDARLPHSQWLKNREFAKQITDKMNSLYPGLGLDYRVQSGRYNQHLHPRAILLEVGNDLNSLEEAFYAIELFAQSLHELLDNPDRS